MTTAMPRVGHLFAGYDGIGMAVEAIWPDSQIAWVSDVCKFNKDGTVGHHEPHRAPCSILAHHYPDVPNIGDVTTVDWSKVQPVDILTGGSPCQDLSHAGKRAGMTEGTRSNLWVAMREAIAQLRPSIVIWENVRGAYTAEADSDLVTNPRLLADTRRRDGQPLLRALGRVLGDLSELGYVGGWHGLRAADVGAPHGRFRVFVVASNARRVGRNEALKLDGRGTASGNRRSVLDESDRDALRAGSDRGVTLFRTPTSQLAINGGSQHPDKRKAGGHGPTLADEVEHLLPTPTVQHSARNSTAGRAPDAKPHADGDTLADLVFDGRLLATPRAFGSRTSRHAASTAQRRSAPSLEQQVEIAEGITPREIVGADVQESWRATWGDYAPAIARWEDALGRLAPAPTMISAKGNAQLSPIFVEWLMGLPSGWVTDVPGITRNEALKALGNGVVHQQGEAAIRFLLGLIFGERAA